MSCLLGHYSSQICHTLHPSLPHGGGGLLTCNWHQSHTGEPAPFHPAVGRLPSHMNNECQRSPLPSALLQYAPPFRKSSTQWLPEGPAVLTRELKVEMPGLTFRRHEVNFYSAQYPSMNPFTPSSLPQRNLTHLKMDGRNKRHVAPTARRRVGMR